MTDPDTQTIRGLASRLAIELDEQDPDAIRAAARNTKVIYDAFVEAGFTADQALVLTINVIGANTDGGQA
jgi:hypothetical protein